MYEKRVARAVELFKSGYNCSQSVVAAFADLYGLTETQALLVSASFGGGIGRMRQTCGAACGLFMLLGLETGTTDADDRAAKSHNYAVVQELAEAFRRENGSLICSELLGLNRASSPTADGMPTPTRKRPCVMMVESAARLFARYLSEHRPE